MGLEEPLALPVSYWVEFNVPSPRPSPRRRRSSRLRTPPFTAEISVAAVDAVRGAALATVSRELAADAVDRSLVANLDVAPGRDAEERAALATSPLRVLVP
jgi:hypothetical protein